MDNEELEVTPEAKEEFDLESIIAEFGSVPEEQPEQALDNFRQCLARINSQENYDAFLHSGFHVLLRDEKRSIEDTLALAESMLGLKK